MFYYYGRKKRLAGLYPEPRFDTIVEPFAGSAAYSLHGDNWKRDVRINDLDAEVVSLWRYLQHASVSDIESLPTLVPGDRLSSVASLTRDERFLISLHIGPGKNRANDVVSKFSRWESGRRYIAANLHKIKHWKIGMGDYVDLPNVEATWFVDPPYEMTGRLYRHHSLDYARLARWVLARRGEAIVCEQGEATWLPFRHLAAQKNAGKHVSRETVWLSTENGG